MAYYLTIKEKNEYKSLDITGLEEFRKLSRYKNASYSLEEIDNFTSQFESELSLKRKLFDCGIITIEDITKDINIRIKTSGKLEKVHYGLVYKHMIKYLDISYLRCKLLELQNDIVFLNKLLDHYRNSHHQESLRQINALLHGYNGNDINIYSALNMFFQREIFNQDFNTGLTTIKYKPLHDLAMFVYNYISKKGKSNIEQETIKLGRMAELNTLKQTLKNEKNYIPIKTKKKTRTKKYELEGQISFF